MKKVLIYIAIATTHLSYSQNTETEKLIEQIQENTNFQLELLEAYNELIKKEIQDLRKQYKVRSIKDLNLKKEKLKKTTYANIEAIVGITDNEGLGYHGNFSIEINTEKQSGIEMGFFYDNNDVHTYDGQVPSEIFILNLGYTKQLNFLSNKAETISTRLAMGGCMGAEVLNDGEGKLSTGAIIATEDGLIYGGYIGIFSLFKISNKFSAVFRNTNFITSSDVSLHKFIVGAGLRYNF